MPSTHTDPASLIVFAISQLLYLATATLCVEQIYFCIHFSCHPPILVQLTPATISVIT